MISFRGNLIEGLAGLEKSFGRLSGAEQGARLWAGAAWERAALVRAGLHGSPVLMSPREVRLADFVDVPSERLCAGLHAIWGGVDVMGGLPISGEAEAGAMATAEASGGGSG